MKLFNTNNKNTIIKISLKSRYLKDYAHYVDNYHINFDHLGRQ